MKALLVIYTLLTILPFINGRLQGRLLQLCGNTTECESEDLNSHCVPDQESPGNNTCQCKPEYVEDTGSCKVPPGRKCNATIECVNNAVCRGHAGELRCYCNPGLVEEARLCKVPPGEECNKTYTCVKGAHCVGPPGNTKCFCDTNFEPEGSFCKVSLGGECDMDEECVENAICNGTAENLLCECDSEFVEEGKYCKKPEGGHCAETADCVNNAHCSMTNDTCVCNDGFAPSDGFCKVAAGQKCSDTEECVRNSTCIGSPDNQICECKDGFKQDLGQCRLPFPGEGCLPNPGCYPGLLVNGCLPDGEGNTTCQCENGYLPSGRNCRFPDLNEPCMPNPGCADTMDCLQNICHCMNKYVEEDGICKVPDGGVCEDNVKCVNGSSCSTNTCKCGQDFVPESGLCKKKVGEPCEPEKDECVENSTCTLIEYERYTCKCDRGYMPDSSKERCMLPGLEEQCMPDLGCASTELECFQETCRCNTDTFIEEDGICKKQVGEECDFSECVNNAFCGGTCKCKENFVLELGYCKIPVGGECVPTYPDDCVNNADCPNRICYCSTSFVEESGYCKKRPGYSCEPDMDDCMRNSTCRSPSGGNNPTCECDPGCVEDWEDGADVCKVSPGGSCSETSECVDNAFCDETTDQKQCQCKTGLLVIGGFCRSCGVMERISAVILIIASMSIAFSQ